MAFATGTGTNKSFDAIFQDAENVARQVKREAQAVHDVSAAGDLDAQRVIRYFDSLGTHRTKLETLVAGVPGTEANAYARERYNDAGYDVAAEYVAMRDAMQTVLDWIAANAGTDLLTWNATTERWVHWDTYTVGQTGGFRSVLNDLIAAID